MKEYRDVILLSGGVDSAYLATEVRAGLCLFIDYGQAAAHRESRAAGVIAKAEQHDFAVIRVHPMPLGQMALGIGPCVVPARNLWLISLAAAFGDRVWIGAAPQDADDYEDCRPEFLDALDASMQSIGRSLQYSTTPREMRVQRLRERDLIEYCWSCYGAGPEPCGECASCKQ